MESLKELRTRLKSLTVFRELRCDPVISALISYLDTTDGDTEAAADAYAAFVAEVYSTNSAHLGEHVRELCYNSENVYVKRLGCKKTPPESMCEAVKYELETLQRVSELTPSVLIPEGMNGITLPAFESGGISLTDGYTYRCDNIGRYGYGIYARNHMFYLSADAHIIPVRHPDGTTLDSLVDYESQRKVIIDNTRALLEGRPAANVLLTGDAGTGKSSTVKAVANALYPEGLRIIEVRKDQLYLLPQILDELAENPLKFILFIDDLSFGKDDDNFSALKAVLEGSVSSKSNNVVIYATSNRRHIVKEKFSDREGDDIHRNDTMQELVSLSERFGLHVTFVKPNKETYLHIVKSLADSAGVTMAEDELTLLAERFALERGGRSARLARQFVDRLLAER